MNVYVPRKIVDLDLSTIPEDELVYELENRGFQSYHTDDLLDLPTLLTQLKKHGCPVELIDKIWEWDRTPIADQIKLRHWQASIEN